MGRFVAATAFAVVAVAAACSTFSADETPTDGGDGGAPDVVEAAIVPAVYNDMTDPTKWQKFDLSAAAPRQGYSGGAFDGRYVYFTPTNDGIAPSSVIARYDTTAPAFNTDGAWTSYDLTKVDVRAKGFFGAVFDGRTMFLPSSVDSLVVAFDSTQPFNEAASWKAIDTSAAAGDAGGFNGAVSDGKYIYLAQQIDSRSARFQPGAPLEIFDTNNVDLRATGYCGAVFDGQHHVYFVPFNNNRTYNGYFVRFDTQAAFAIGESWQTFEAEAKGLPGFGFCGGVTVGKYVYFAPSFNGQPLRYDTGITFGDPAAWAAFDAAKIDPTAKGYRGAAFDGRYVYLVPYANAGGDAPAGTIVRFDTQAASFTDPAAWSAFDLTKLDPNARGFVGAVYDGRWLYLVPHVADYGIALRFDTKAPPSLPSGTTGSFL